MPEFLRLWVVGAIANAMRWTEMLAAGLFTLDATHSPFLVAAVVALRMLPLLLFGAFAGALAEALNRRRVLAAGFVAMAANALLVAGVAGHDALGVGLVAACGFVSGTMWAGEMATRRRMIGEVAGADRLSQAIALDSVTNAGTRMVGPVFGGAAYEWLGMAGAYLCAGLAFALCGALVAGMRYAQETRPLVLARIPAEIAEGLAAAWSRPPILMVFAVTMIMNVFAFSYSGLIAPIAQDGFGVSPTLVGVLAAGEPLGAMIGALLLVNGRIRLSRNALFCGGSALFLAAVVVMSQTGSYAVALAVLVFGGIGSAGFGNMQSTVVMTQIPAAIRSRVLGVVTVCIGTGPLGVLLVGALAGPLGANDAVAVVALTGLVLIGLVWVGLGRR